MINAIANLPEWCQKTYFVGLGIITFCTLFVVIVSSAGDDWPITFEDADDKWRWFSAGVVGFLLWPVVAALSLPALVVFLIGRSILAWLRLIPSREDRRQKKQAEVESLRAQKSELIGG